jgi:sugar phosphate isomerase/epimerase
MNLDIGLQLFSVKGALAQDYIGTLERIAAIGYRNLELVIRVTDGKLSLGGDITPTVLRQQLDRLGMRAVSAHTRVDANTDWPRIIAASQELGNTAIGCSIAFFADMPDVLAFCEMFNRAGAVCREGGLQLYYHNHFQEFQVFEGQRVFDLLLAHTDPALVKFEFDTYWAARGGADPVAWLRTLGERCDLLHQKDLPVTAQPVNWFEVFGFDSRITLTDLYKTQDPAQFAGIGAGTMDIPAIIAAARDLVHARYIFVEQDVTAGDEVEGVALSYANLERMLQRA